MILKFLKQISFIAILVCTISYAARSQYSGGQVLDNIIVKVDDFIILKSDLEKAYLEFVSRGQKGGEDVKCGILESLVINKVLVAKAEIDSVIVEDDEVQSNLDQRMQIIVAQIGSEEKLEQYYGKTVEDFKDELFDQIKEQLVADKMQRTITDDITVTPTEVKRFFNKIPSDSLPFLSTEVEVGQIVKIPKPGTFQKDQARKLALELRNRILNGRDISKDYAGWKINIMPGNSLTIIDNTGKEYRGKYEFDERLKQFAVSLNEISFLANEFQGAWNISRGGQDSLRFNNADLSNTSRIYLKKDSGIPRNYLGLDYSVLTGQWSVIGFFATGEDFAALAAKYSNDPGSARSGGVLGFAPRGVMVPEYEAAAMRMSPGEISQPIESEYGFHIIQLIERRGNEFNSRHILIRPDFSSLDFKDAENFLDSLRNLIITDSIPFENAAKEFSDDERTSGNGGFIFDDNGSARVSVETLDPVVFFTIDTMEVGNITRPMRYRMEDGKEAVRILYHKSKYKPHQANLKDDYQKIQLAALNEKKQIALEQWFDNAKGDVFILIDESYKQCQILE